MNHVHGFDRTRRETTGMGYVQRAAQGGGTADVQCIVLTAARPAGDVEIQNPCASLREIAGDAEHARTGSGRIPNADGAVVGKGIGSHVDGAVALDRAATGIDQTAGGTRKCSARDDDGAVVTECGAGCIDGGGCSNFDRPCGAIGEAG